MALGELKNGIGPDAYAIYQQVLAAVVERDHPWAVCTSAKNPTSPAELYGGTWEQIKRQLLSWPLAIPMRQVVRVVKLTIH